MFQAIAKELAGVKQVELSDTMGVSGFSKVLKGVPSIFDLVQILEIKNNDPFEMAAAIEFIFEGLVSLKIISKRRVGAVHQFKALDKY